MRLFRTLLLIFLAAAIGGCASTSLRSARQAGSLVDFLYLKATAAGAPAGWLRSVCWACCG